VLDFSILLVLDTLERCATDAKYRLRCDQFDANRQCSLLTIHLPSSMQGGNKLKKTTKLKKNHGFEPQKPTSSRRIFVPQTQKSMASRKNPNPKTHALPLAIPASMSPKQSTVPVLKKFSKNVFFSENTDKRRKCFL
jgi:hypothetical protein